jgi:chorismate synthase
MRVAVGAVAMKLLSLLGVEGVGYVPGMAGVWSRVPFSWDLLARIEASPVRMTDPEAEAEVIRRIDQAKAEGDTLGGVLEARFRGLVPGLGATSTGTGSWTGGWPRWPCPSRRSRGWRSARPLRTP